MKQWFPFTDYDFYAYLTSGMFLIAAVDYTFAGSVLIGRTEWTVVQIVFWTAVAYVLGQLVAGPSAAILESLLARRVLHPPISLLLGLSRQRRRERLLAHLFVDRGYEPLPRVVRQRILDRAARAYEVEPGKLSPEAIFHAAYTVARTNPDSAGRLDQFRNLYGFSRNLCFVAALASVLLSIRALEGATATMLWILTGAVVLMVGMFGRFLKFYGAFAREVLQGYNSAITETGGKT